MNSKVSISGRRVGEFFRDNIVTLIVILFIAVGLLASEGLSFGFFINELLARFFRNGFLVLALIIPVIAGLGLNFGIVAGALTGMLATLFVRYHEGGGLGGLLMCFLLAMPLAILVGFLTGRLYNKTRGQEMIASLIVGFFANGIYWLIALVAVGTLIPVSENHVMIIPGGVGIVSTFDMGWHPLERVFDPEFHTVGLKYALDWIWRVPFAWALIVLGGGYLAVQILRRNRDKHWMFIVKCVISSIIILIGLQTLLIPSAGIIVLLPQFIQNLGIRGILIPGSIFSDVRSIPAVTGFVIIALCLFTQYFTKTKIGQDCRSVGQSQNIANVSGINVDRTRVIATIISTVLAAWGMIISMQNIGTVNTYGAHMNIGFFSVASLLVGGASTSKANVKNALIGLILFHAMFIVSPAIGRLIAPGNENVGEYTRSSMVYGIIAISLGLHVWKTHQIAKSKTKLEVSGGAEGDNRLDRDRLS